MPLFLSGKTVKTRCRKPDFTYRGVNRGNIYLCRKLKNARCFFNLTLVIKRRNKQKAVIFGAVLSVVTIAGFVLERCKTT